MEIAKPTALELWGGVECSVVRIGDDFRNQFEETGHLQNLGDLDAIASLGIRTLRYPVLWETVAPDNPENCCWEEADRSLDRLRSLGIRPIAGLLHHGSGPAYTNLADPGFPQLFAKHAARVARRYPWLELFTPVNEPLTTARFSGLYGHWYPHGHDLQTFFRCLVNQCLATVFAMKAIREVIPHAQLIQTEDLGKTFSTDRLAYQAAYENERRWLSLDLLMGRVGASHPWHELLVKHGIGEWELDLLESGDAAPDIIGINYYATSERYLDENLHLYPSCFHGQNGGDPKSFPARKHRYADVEALRVDLPDALLGPKARLSEAWERYRRPMAVTEVHHGSSRDEQLRWLAEVWKSAAELKADGQDIRAVTLWSLLGAIDWNSLLTERKGFYEPGAFDIRGAKPRLTAIGKAARKILETGLTEHPALDQPGWWRRDGRHYHPPARKAPALLKKPRVILVAGSETSLGREIIEHCRLRALDIALLDRTDVGAGDGAQVEQAFARHKPWAVIDAAGLSIDTAAAGTGTLETTCRAGLVLAKACSRRDIPLVTFSADRVFDGSSGFPYVESDAVTPPCIIGLCMAAAEKRIAYLHPRTLIIRCSTLFGGGDGISAIPAFRTAMVGNRCFAAGSYMPHLVSRALDLLIDDEEGVWHLANEGALSLEEASEILGRSRQLKTGTDRLVVLGSEKGLIMPSLREALSCLRDSLAARQPTAPSLIAAE